MDPTALRVRPLRREELGAVEDHLGRGAPGRHRARLLMQEEEGATYFIAWRGERPVGHLLLHWTGSLDDHVRERLDVVACPDQADLWVRPDARRAGVATGLLEAAEALVRERGYDRIGLDVGVENELARAVYRRRGYRDAGLGRWEIGQGDPAAGGWREIVEYWIREFRPCLHTVSDPNPPLPSLS